MLLALVAFVACRPDSPVAPEHDGFEVGGPRFDFTGGTGKVLGSTDQGELVEIDLDAGTVTFIGDAGVFQDAELNWRDLAFMDSDTLFMLGQSPQLSGTYLYKVNFETGTVFEGLGQVEQTSIEGLAFQNDTLFANACCSRIFGWIDETVPDLIWLSEVNAFIDPVNGSLMEEGGLAVHPTTGDIWGIENTVSQPRNIYRIDRATAEPDSIMRLGLNGSLATFGFDGLFILNDGTFLGTRHRSDGGSVPSDSALYEIIPERDSVSGLAEISPIPLTFDSLVEGRLTGLESFLGPPQDSTVTLQLTADTTELHPWIREFLQPADNGTIDQDQDVADTTNVTFKAFMSGAPVDSLPVVFTAEFIPRTGGHHHLDDTLRFSDAPLVQAGDAKDRPVTGYIKQGLTRVAELTDTTDSNGEVAFAFVAGFVGGDAKLIASAVHAGDTIADTLDLTIRVPDLLDLEDGSTVDDNAYLIGQTIVPGSSPPDTVHARDSIWHATSAFATALEDLAEDMVRDSAGVSYYLQVNDASLPFGGSFSVVPFETEEGQLIERAYFRGHRLHALGIDVDIGWCQVRFTGEDGQGNRISGTDCSGNGGVAVDYEDLLTSTKSLGLILLRETEGLPHYHVRFQEGS